MPDLFKPLEGDDIAVAHLSDPHFGSDNDDNVWKLVREFLIKRLKPRLVLVSGDLVHLPAEDTYQRAADYLQALGEALKVDYFVCAGNHDRHHLGNRLTSNNVKGILKLPAVKQALRWSIGIAALFLLTFIAVLGVFVNAWAAGALLLAAAAIIGWFAWRWKKFKKSFDVGAKGALFENKFSEHTLGFQKAKRVQLKYGQNDWSLGLLSLDSSSRADCFARGYVGTDQLTNLSSAVAEDKGADLCLLMVHHHLLSIRGLEDERREQSTDLLNVTGMVNSGNVLENLARARVDLVLHGHEHMHNSATYCSVNPSYAPVRVVGAGSVNGNDSIQGCRENHASFNILILSPDRSVRLRRVYHKENTWCQDNDVPLFAPEEVRQSKVRRAMLKDAQGTVIHDSLVRSEIIKSFEFTRERDIKVSWILTDWYLAGAEFRQPCVNSTGEPAELEVVVTAAGMPPVKLDATSGANFKWHGDHTWNLCFPIGESLQAKRVHISVTFVWRAGALLTHEELNCFREKRALAVPRNQGLESITVWAMGNLPVAALEAHLILPPEYAPSASDFQMHVHEDYVEWDNWNNRREEARHLKLQVRNLGDGRYALRIPFPRLDCNYSLTWTPVPQSEVLERLGIREPLTEFANRCCSDAERLLKRFATAFRETPLWDRATASLFVANPDSPQAVFCQTVPLGSPLRDPPPLMTTTLNSERSLLVRAFWGSIVSESRPPEAAKAEEFGFCPDEQKLLCVPIRFAIGSWSPPVAVVIRIGVWKEAMELIGTQDDDKIGMLLNSAVTRFLAHAMRGS